MNATSSSTPPYGVRLFTTAMVLAVLGAVAFFVGIGAAFERAGNWSGHLVDIGVILLVVAVLANFVATFTGLRELLISRAFPLWLPVSALLTLACFVGAYLLLQL